MLKLGLTGKIASGKSQVEKILLSENFKVIDSDKANHNLYKGNPNQLACRLRKFFLLYKVQIISCNLLEYKFRGQLCISMYNLSR